MALRVIWQYMDRSVTQKNIIWTEAHDPLNNNNYIYIFRNIKTLNYVLFLLCVCLIYQS